MTIVSVVRDPEVGYPGAAEHSPSSAYPERLFGDEPAGANRVYDLVRRSLSGAGLDTAQFGSPNWNPLGKWVEPGSSVFILPNSVVHRRPGESDVDFHGKTAQGAVLRAVADYATIASGDASNVRFGSASIQSCDFGGVCDESGMSAVGQFYRDRTGHDIGPLDLRAVVTRWHHGALLERREQNLEDIVLIDLGRDSLLDALSTGGREPRFRVSDYDHREIGEYHGPGRHVYAVHRSVLEARTVISVPTLKTHEKVGITCALKGTVGSIARKECLAHHRKGSPAGMGDEYPRASIARDFASTVADHVSVLGPGLASNALRIFGKGLYRLLRTGRGGIMAGAWHGNDTAWRMAVDIARIIRFGTPDGRLADTPQRHHLTFIDGIVGGEGEGPVYPTGHPAGVVLFGSDPAWSDYAAALVMGYDPARIPIIVRSMDSMRYPVTTEVASDVRTVCNGKPVEMAALGRLLDRPFVPPKGWKGWIEAAPVSDG